MFGQNKLRKMLIRNPDETQPKTCGCFTGFIRMF